MRPPDMLDDSIWELLEKCWNTSPRGPPSTVEVYNTLKSCRKDIPTPLRWPAIGELPGALKLHFHSINFPDGFGHGCGQQFRIKFKYGNGSYTTSPTEPNRHGDYTWNILKTWVIKTDEKCHGHTVSFKLLVRTGLLKKDKVCAAGDFSLIENANKHIVIVAPMFIPSFDFSYVAEVKILVVAI